jgi:hypothetical protein
MKPNVNAVPATWTIADWPADVYPCKPDRGRQLVRKYEAELTRCGALARIGKVKVIFGAEYMGWMHGQANRVTGYVLPMNKARRKGVG